MFTQNPTEKKHPTETKTMQAICAWMHSAVTKNKNHSLKNEKKKLS